MEILGNKNAAVSPLKYFCNICEYTTSHKSHYDGHLSSLKHSKWKQMEINGNKTAAESILLNKCCEICNKDFISRSGLWKHKKICNNGSLNEIFNDKELIIMLIKQNSELIKECSDFKNIVLEITKNGTNNNNNNTITTTTHTNSHNKAFNLNFFLNETCKDAMNIGEFVDSLKIQLLDLEK